jgi:snapalysin
MRGRRLARTFIGVLLGLVLGSLQLVASPAAAATELAAPRILTYDASRAAEFVAVVHQGANVWNSHVANVKLQPVRAGARANIIVTADNGWPRALTTTLGNGRWIMGRTAVRDGHSPPRIAAHEFGHLLGLPDRRTGRCTDLMSGASAGTSCTNPNPNAAEIREVERNFARGATPAFARTFADARAEDCFF